MPTGQRTLQLFTLVKSGDEDDIPAFCDDGKFDCDFKIPVFADASGEDLKNDKSSILIMPEDWVSAITFVIQKYSGSAWSDQATISDQSYGEYYDQGDLEGHPTYAGIVLYWSNILSAFGAGEYRIKITQTNPIEDAVSFSRTYCLKEYNCIATPQVRLEWECNDGYGDIDDDKKILDFSDLNWYFQIRLPGFFGYPVSEYEEDEIQYSNGEIQTIDSVQTETYQLKIGGVPAWVHNLLKSLAMQADTLRITDYSENNPQELKHKYVRRSSSYEPRWKTGSKCAPVTVELKPTNSRLERFACL